MGSLELSWFILMSFGLVNFCAWVPYSSLIWVRLGLSSSWAVLGLSTSVRGRSTPASSGVVLGSLRLVEFCDSHLGVPVEAQNVGANGILAIC